MHPVCLVMIFQHLLSEGIVGRKLQDACSKGSLKQLNWEQIGPLHRRQASCRSHIYSSLTIPLITMSTNKRISLPIGNPDREQPPFLCC